MKKDNWARVVAPADAEGVNKEREGEGTPAPVNSGLTMYAMILSSGKTLEKELSGRKVYVHVIQTSSGHENAPQGARVKLSDGAGGELVLSEGDGAYVAVNGSSPKLLVENVSGEDGPTAEILLFDMDAN
jgi:hypothetical protein